MIKEAEFRYFLLHASEQLSAARKSDSEFGRRSEESVRPYLEPAEASTAHAIGTMPVHFAVLGMGSRTSRDMDQAGDVREAAWGLTFPPLEPLSKCGTIGE